MRALGWRVLGRNVRTPFAEIDLVAWDGSSLVCVEVKSSGGAAFGGFGPRRNYGDRQRLRQGRAATYLARRVHPGAPARVELLEVVFPAKGAAARIRRFPMHGARHA